MPFLFLLFRIVFIIKIGAIKQENWNQAMEIAFLPQKEIDAILVEFVFSA